MGFAQSIYPPPPKGKPPANFEQSLRDKLAQYFDIPKHTLFFLLKLYPMAHVYHADLFLLGDPLDLGFGL